MRSTAPSSNPRSWANNGRHHLMGATFARSLWSIQPFHADVFVADDAVGIVGLESERSAGQLAGVFRSRLGAGWLGVLQEIFPVNFHRDLVSLHDDVLGPPLMVLHRAQPHLHHSPEA